MRIMVPHALHLGHGVYAALLTQEQVALLRGQAPRAATAQTQRIEVIEILGPFEHDEAAQTLAFEVRVGPLFTEHVQGVGKEVIGIFAGGDDVGGGAAASASAPSTRRTDGQQVVEGATPSTTNPQLQAILTALLSQISHFYTGGFRYYPGSGRYISEPNFLTIRVQERKANNIVITAYGTPDRFGHIVAGTGLDLKLDRRSSSRFSLQRQEQVPTAVAIIQRSMELKAAR